MEKEILLGKNPNEIQEVVNELGLPKFTGKQLMDWLYQKRCASFDEMTNLSKSARALLSEHYETGLVAPIKEQLSKDNVLFHLDGEPIWGDLYMKGWYQNLSEQTESIKDIPYLAKATCASIGSPYSFEPMFTVTFTNGATAEATGLAYELHVEDNSGFYRFSKMVFPFTMTKQ